MSTRHVLLVPHEGDPLGLLKDGPCGAMPPHAVWVEDVDGWRGADDVDVCEEDKIALVLAWDGKVVIEGCDRAFRRLRPDYRSGCHDLGDAKAARAASLGEWLSSAGGGCTLVVITADALEEIRSNPTPEAS